MVKLMVDDIDSFDYDVGPDFAEGVIEARRAVGQDDMSLVFGIEHAAGSNCFGSPRRCTSDIHGEVLEVSLYGDNLNIREIQEFVKQQDDLRLGNFMMIDDGWRPAHLLLILVDSVDDNLWA